MAEINIAPDNTGMNLVRNVGMQLRTLLGSVSFDNSYPTGGIDFDMSNYFPKGVLGVIVSPQDGYVFEYDKTAKKIKAYAVGAEAGAMAEVANETDLSAVTNVSFIALGV